jgi:hypothetical protein
VILFDAGDRVVAAFSEKLSGKVGRQFGELGALIEDEPPDVERASPAVR